MPDTAQWESARIQHFVKQQIGREEAHALLRNGYAEGEYIIRTSKSQPGVYVLSMSHGGKVHHFQINYDVHTKEYITSNGHRFPTLEVSAGLGFSGACSWFGAVHRLLTSHRWFQLGIPFIFYPFIFYFLPTFL